MALPPIRWLNVGGGAMTTNYSELPLSDHIKLINTEYEHIDANERSNLQKAIPIGKMLIDLKPRVSEFGEWQDWVKTNLPKISYETVSLYMRFAKPDNLAKILAAGKSASVADLKMTITEASKVIAKKPTATTGTKSGKSAQAGGVPEPDGAKASAASTDPKEIILALAPDELFTILKDDADYVRSLFQIIKDHYKAAGDKIKRDFSPAAASA
jgi:hypothetical protein